MEKSKSIVYVIAVVVLISLAYTAWSFIRQQPDKKKYKNYLPVTASITDKLAGRVSRYGAKPTRYHLVFTAKDGKKYTASNITLGEELQPGDTVTVYYNPDNPGDEVVRSLP
ncbi:DUF3592 domain-containing protein [Chitinophaga varians]|uniref:DUF3592 domain-containing protein n=1 Tax=Chitinophaga varians TaxID=2202339 RepID=UPI00165ED0CD|nr:DUF3592 domain-containing protein [Chitinophaga varians]MBC9913107.1 DUF3592 domain-containing protein [Chitinophaga varians]